MWIAAKLSQPRYASKLVRREKIEQQLDQITTQKLVLFQSPTGFGKSCAVSHWLQSKSHVGWFKIDPQDNDPMRFADYFLAALQQAVFQQLPTQQHAANQTAVNLLDCFSQTLSTLGCLTQRCYLVLEDLHHVTHPEILAALRYFIEHQPDNLVLVITSRSIPELGIGKLRIQGLLCEFSQSHLAFDLNETQRFFALRQNENVTAAQVDHIHHHVEGWPAALELIALQHWTPNYSLESFGTQALNTHYLWQYLVEEVFSELNSNTQSFLLQCSVLQQFNITLAREVTQHVDTQKMLETLMQQGLFVKPSNNTNNWFRFDNLFAEFLNHERSLRQPQLEITLHQRAARGWLKSQNPNQALQHAQHAKDYQLIKQILSEHGWGLLNRSDTQTLQHALSALPKTIIEQDFNLSILRAWSTLLAGRHQRFKRYESHIESSQLAQNSEQLGELYALQAKATVNQHPKLALELAQQALVKLEMKAYYSRIVATSVIAKANQALGHLDRALPLTQQCEKLARQYQTSEYVVWALGLQADIAFERGYLQAAFELQETGLTTALPQQHDWLVSLSIQRGYLLLNWGRVAEAKQLIRNLLKQNQTIKDNHAIHCHAILVRIALIYGNLNKARHYQSTVEAKLALLTEPLIDPEQVDLTCLLYWQASHNLNAIHMWLDNTSQPSECCNHASQLQARNIVRAQIYLSDYLTATQNLRWLQQQARQYHLSADACANTVLEALLAIKEGYPQQIQSTLTSSLKLTNQHLMLGEYLADLHDFKPHLQTPELHAEIDELLCYRIKQLLTIGEVVKRTKQMTFDAQFVTQLVDNKKIPPELHNSPLTQREWQVLGLIYAGLSNEQIAQQLDVAGTTIKTHIRNLYQKLNIANRKQAITTAATLVKLAQH